MLPGSSVLLRPGIRVPASTVQVILIAVREKDARAMTVLRVMKARPAAVLRGRRPTGPEGAGLWIPAAVSAVRAGIVRAEAVPVTAGIHGAGRGVLRMTRVPGYRAERTLTVRADRVTVIPGIPRAAGRV